MTLRSRIAVIAFIISTLFAFPLFAEESPEPEAPATRSITLTLRDESAVIWQGAVSIPDSDTATTSIAATDGTIADALAASALAALAAADSSAPEFSISNLQYFSSYGSFYTKCITAATEKCDNWQYVVGDTYPSVGMDQFVMHDGDTLFVFFGSPRRVTLSTTTVAVNESFTATAERYIPASDSYAPALGFTLGVTQPNPDNPYSPLVITSAPVDASGSALFTLTATGTYAVGIAEDYYYPTVALTVEETHAQVDTSAEEETEETPNEPQQSSGGGGGGGGGAPTHFDVNISNALSFLARGQNTDGSFATQILSDWAALAFAATPEYESEETILRRYLMNAGADFTSLTDYERRAMALMALGVNPYTGTPTDYITKIRSYFDGKQFGDASFVNDDIFALFPLLRAGYGARDEIVGKSVEFILSQQKMDGSWDGNVDMTAAAIQALSALTFLPGTNNALTRAMTFLHGKQITDGGFGNSFSTSWALQAIHALGSDPTSWQSSGRYPEDYLASIQSSDGGLESISSDSRTRIWATEYAIPAALGKPWLSLLSSFARPTSGSLSGGSANITATTTVSATTTPFIATYAPIVEEIVPVAPSGTDAASASVEKPLKKRSIVESAPALIDTVSYISSSTIEMPEIPVPPQVAAAAAAEPAGVIIRILRWLVSIGATVRMWF